MKRLALLAFGLGLATWLTGCCCCGQNLGCGGCGGGCASGACGAPVYHGGGCSSGACGM